MPKAVRYMLRSLGAMGLLDRIHGMVWGKPYEEAYREEYAVEIRTVLKEYGREALPVLTNLSFGHCEPKCVIPYGALAQIDCEKPNVFYPGKRPSYDTGAAGIYKKGGIDFPIPPFSICANLI